MAIAGGAIWLAGLGGELFFETPLAHLGESTRHLVGSAISSSPRWIAVETEEQHGWARRSGRVEQPDPADSAGAMNPTRQQWRNQSQPNALEILMTPRTQTNATDSVEKMFIHHGFFMLPVIDLRLTKMRLEPGVIDRSIPLNDRAAMNVATGDDKRTAKMNTGSQADVLKRVRKPGGLRSVDSPKDSVVTYAAESASIGMDDTAAANSAT